jgi:AAA+ ATPase superfamily predicted ATPase
MIENPFLTYGYEGSKYFCDRKEETKDIIETLRNGCNLTLMSPRRYGKTGLIHNVFQQIKEQGSDITCFYIDIYATHSLSDFVQALGKAVAGKLDTPLQKVEGFVSKVFRYSQITMEPNLATGMPQFSLNFQPQYAESTLEDIFNYIEQSGRTCYIALDEFQQVLEYQEKNVEALLRTYTQRTHNIHFIFAGSKQHLMDEMFNSPKHPFYRSTEKMNLTTLKEDVYYDFATDKLSRKGIVLTAEEFHKIYGLVDGVTWYLQAIMNRIYRLENCEINEEVWRKVINQIIAREEENYKRLYHILTANQASLLLAVAKEGIVEEPLSGAFLRRNNLKSPSSVQRALQFLMDEEYLYHTDNGYIVYDRFFGMWLK